MIPETWTTIAVPLLEGLLNDESSDVHAATSDILKECSEDGEILVTLSALMEDGYVTGGGVFWPLGRGKPVITDDVLRLTPKGRRAVGQWPLEQPAEAFLQNLEKVLNTMPEGEARSKVQTLLAATRGVGTDVLAGVISNFLKSVTGL